MTDETTAGLAVTPEGVGAPIVTVDDAIAEDARLAAVVEVAQARRADLKAWTLATLVRPGSRVELEGVGAALVTDPNKRAVVVDEDAFRAWALRDRTDRTGTVERIDPAPIERALAGDLGGELAGRLAALLDEIPGAVTVDVVVEAKLAEDERKAGTEHRGEDGTIAVVTEDGERIPGLEVRKASKPVPQIKPDKGLVERLAAEIRGRLAPIPELEESTR